MEKKTCEGYMLLIETATSICSVALSFGDELVAFKESNVPNSHSAMLNVLIDELLKENGVSYGDIVAVALSIGPGSYTGLRIGSSTAKGLAYALSVPVITIDTLDILAFAAHETHNGCFVIAMIDARRMEVYSKIFDCDMNVVRGCRADVLCEDFYDEFFSENDRVLTADFTTATLRLSSALSSFTARSISSPTTVVPYSQRIISSMSYCSSHL